MDLPRQRGQTESDEIRSVHRLKIHQGATHELTETSALATN